jgi:hypothetical protein
MRSLSAAIALVLLFYSLPLQASTPADQVRSAIAGMNRAAAKLDADEFMHGYWESPDLAITFDGKTMRGWSTILREQRKWWSDKHAGTTFSEQRPPEVIAQDGNIVTSIQWMSVSNAANKKPSQLVITSVWKRLPEGWRIVLAHETLTP